MKNNLSKFFQKMLGREHTLSIQLLVVFIISALILVGIFGALIKQLAERRVHSEFEETITAKVKVFSDLLLDDVITNNKEELWKNTYRLSKSNQYLVSLKIKNGQNNYLVKWNRHPSLKYSPAIKIHEVLEVAGQKFGDLYVSWSTSGVKIEIDRRINLAMKLVTILLVITFIPVLFFIHFLVLRPINYINRRLNGFTRGNNYPELERKQWRTKEFNNLGETIDVLKKEIEARRRAEKLLEQAKDKANEANQAKSDFLASMSHELRTPLNAILGYSELIEESAVDQDSREMIADSQKIRTAGAHLLSLIDSVLNLAKIESGKVELDYSETNIYSLVYDVCGTIEPLLLKSNNHLEIKCDPKIGAINIDRIRLRQILFNLLNNATKFTEQGVVTIEATRIQPGNRVKIIISDTGIGIKEDQLHCLFKEFSQTDKSISTQYGGTGLGLSISQKLSEMMGGEIKVVSKYGQGSVFTVSFPDHLADNKIDQLAG